MALEMNITNELVAKNPAKKEILKLFKTIGKQNQKMLSAVEQELINEKQMKALEQELQQYINELEGTLQGFTNIAYPKSFVAGEDLADTFIRAQQKVKDNEGNIIKLYDIQPRDKANPKYMEAINTIQTKSLREVKAISNNLRDNLDKAVKKSMYELNHPTIGQDNLKMKIKDILTNEGIKITDSRGRLWNPVHYSSMYARTRTREYQTAGIEYRMNEVGMDLVMISTHIDVDGMDICNEHEGNVYSLSGKHEKYPKIPVHTPFHPRCAHVETPWSEKYHEVEPRNRLGLDEQQANEIIENIEDIKTPQQMDIYFKDKYNINVNLDDRFNYTPEQLQEFTKVQAKMLDKYPDVADELNDINDFYTRDLRLWKKNYREEEQRLRHIYFNDMSPEDFAKAKGIDISRLAGRKKQMYDELQDLVLKKPNINDYKKLSGTMTDDAKQLGNLMGQYDNKTITFHPEVLKGNFDVSQYSSYYGTTAQEIQEHVVIHEFGHAVDDIYNIVNIDKNEEFFDLWKVVNENFNSEYRDEIMSAKKLTTYYGSTEPKEMFAENFAFMERGGIVKDTEINNYVEMLLDKAGVKIVQETAEEVVENYDDLYRAWKTGLRDREEMAIRNWTGGGYTDIRKYQQGILGYEDEYVAKTIQNLEEAVSKAPKFKGTVYRGLRSLSPDVRERILNSETISFNTFTSTSKSIGVSADTFANKQGVLFEFQNTYTGVDITSLSKFSGEREVLFAKGAEFEVVDRDEFRGIPKLILRQVE